MSLGIYSSSVHVEGKFELHHVLLQSTTLYQLDPQHRILLGTTKHPGSGWKWLAAVYSNIISHLEKTPLEGTLSYF